MSVSHCQVDRDSNPLRAQGIGCEAKGEEGVGKEELGSFSEKW